MQGGKTTWMSVKPSGGFKVHGSRVHQCLAVWSGVCPNSLPLCPCAPFLPRCPVRPNKESTTTSVTSQLILPALVSLFRYCPAAFLLFIPNTKFELLEPANLWPCACRTRTTTSTQSPIPDPVNQYSTTLHSQPASTIVVDDLNPASFNPQHCRLEPGALPNPP